jgi:hypothetical protein
MLDPRKRRRIAAALLLACAFPAGGRAESAFDADPRAKALIVVDAVVRHKTLLATNDSPVVAGTLRNRALEGKAQAHRPSSRAVAGALPFAVDAGRYRPATVHARAQRMQVGTGTIDLQIPMPSDSLPALETTVAPGAVVYLGRVEIMVVPRPFQENQYRFTVTYDRDRERQVWERLLDKAKTGAWEEAIRARLAALAPADSAATSDTTSVDPPTGGKR